MKDTTGQSEESRRSKQADRPLADRLPELLPSYTPKQRRTLVKGLRILARVAVRAHMERQAAVSGNPTSDVEGEQED